MGLGPYALELYERLTKKGVMRPGQRICDVGAQDLVPEQYNLRELVEASGRDWASLESSLGKSSRILMEALGYQYDTIDFAAHHGALRLDLNGVRWEQVGKHYDIVTNFGTSEHVFDQHSCFKLIHDLTEVGGLMIHQLPWRGFESHGFYVYSDNFFFALQKWNRYEVVAQYRHPDSLGVLAMQVYRKVDDGEFKPPIQSVYESWMKGD